MCLCGLYDLCRAAGQRVFSASIIFKFIYLFPAFILLFPLMRFILISSKIVYEFFSESMHCGVATNCCYGCDSSDDGD